MKGVGRDGCDVGGGWLNSTRGTGSSTVFVFDAGPLALLLVVEPLTARLAVVCRAVGCCAGIWDATDTSDSVGDAPRSALDGGMVVVRVQDVKEDARVRTSYDFRSGAVQRLQYALSSGSY